VWTIYFVPLLASAYLRLSERVHPSTSIFTSSKNAKYPTQSKGGLKENWKDSVPRAASSGKTSSVGGSSRTASRHQSRTSGTSGTGDYSDEEQDDGQGIRYGGLPDDEDDEEVPIKEANSLTSDFTRNLAGNIKSQSQVSLNVLNRSSK
jgi:hypothetical protein